MRGSRHSPPTISIPSSEVPEDILAHNLSSPIQYFVKFVGFSYNKCRWLTEVELKETEEGSHLLKYYTDTPSKHKTKEPFYNPKFGKIDRIINKEGSNYIVKWQGLGYDFLTAEKDVPKKEIDLFKKRKTAKFADLNGTTEFIDNVELLPKENLIEEGFTIDEISFLNALCDSYNNETSLTIEENMWFKSAHSVAWFIDYLFHSYKCCGPHLFVVDENLLEKWYSKLRDIPNILTICYVGSPLERELISVYEFTKKKKSLSFHILLTTPQIFQNESKFISSINWDIAVFNSPRLESIVNNKKAIECHLSVVVKCNSTKNAAMRQSLVNCLSKLKEMELINKEQFPFLDETTDYSSHLKEIPSVTCYLVKSTMSITQKRAARILFDRYRDSINNGKFCNVAYALEKNHFHPFLLKNMEYELGFPNFEGSSITILILMKIIQESVDKGKKILISSNMKSDYQILLGVIGGMKIAFKYDEGQRNDDDNDFMVYLHASSVISEFPSIDDFECIVVFDSSPFFLEKWANTIGSYKAKSPKKLYLFASYASIYQKPENMRLSEYICRRCAYEAYYDKETEVDVDELYNSIEEFNIFEPIQKEPPSFVDFELMSDKFWESMLSAPANDITIVDPIEVDSDYPFTMHERNGLIRAIAVFPWGFWNQARENCGTNFSDETISRLSQSIILRIKKEDPSLIIPLFIERSCTNSDFKLDKGVFSAKEFYEAIKRLSHNFTASLESANYIHAFLKGKDVTDFELPSISLPDPLQFGWSSDLDRALLLGVDKYGVNMFDMFPTDEDPMIRKVFKIGKNIPQFDGILVKRAFSYAASIKKIINDSKPERETVKEDGFENWTATEKNNLIDTLINFGIPTDENGEQDLERVAKMSKITKKTPEEIDNYITHVLTNPHKKWLAIYVSNSIFVMHNLHEILNTEIKHQIFQRLPRWEGLPEEWTQDIELEFFEKIEEQGFSAQVDIVKENYAHCFEGELPPSITHRSSLFRRINKIEWLHKKVQNALKEKRHPTFPLQVTETCFVYNLGTVVYDKSAYHTERYIYPVGYKTSRLSQSLDDPNTKIKWYSEIRDGGNSPLFVVYPENHPETIFTGATPTAPWTHAMNAIANAKSEKRRPNSISGPEAFLLSSPIVANLIQKLPNAKLCHHYKFRYFASKNDDDEQNYKNRR